MRTLRSVIESAEMSDKKRNTLIRKIEAVESHGDVLPEMMDEQSNAAGIAGAMIDMAIKNIYGQGAEYRAFLQTLFATEVQR